MTIARALKQRGVTFTHSTPLFLQDKSKTEMLPENIQEMLRFVAQRAGLIDDHNNGHEFNPLGPHSLRESFGSIMTNSGVPDSIVDFWLGHEIGEMAEAYKSVQFDSLKEMYANREKLLSITAPKVDTEELRKKLRMELNEQNTQLQNNFNKLYTEHLELRNSFTKLNMDNTDLKKRIQKTEEDLATVKKLIQEGLKAL
jgi:hypothetical protein